MTGIIEGLKNIITGIWDSIINVIEVISNGFESIINFISHLFQFIGLITHNTVKVIQIALRILPKIYEMIASLPPYIVVFAQLTMGIGIAMLLLGRENGKSE